MSASLRTSVSLISSTSLFKPFPRRCDPFTGAQAQIGQLQNSSYSVFHAHRKAHYEYDLTTLRSSTIQYLALQLIILFNL